MPLGIGPSGTPRGGRQAFSSRPIGSGTSSGGMTVTWQNGATVSAILSTVAKELKTLTNRQLRDASQGIANRHLIPEIKRGASQGGAPKIASHMADTARAKADRVLTVVVGGVNPKGLVGFHPYRRSSRGVGKGASKANRTTLAWGSEFGPLGGRGAGRPGWQAPGQEVNHYGVPRNDSGYYIMPAVNRALPGALEEYTDAFWEIWQWAIGTSKTRYTPSSKMAA